MKHPEIAATACPECGRQPWQRCVGRVAAAGSGGWHAARILASRGAYVRPESSPRRGFDRGGSSTPIPVPHPYYTPIRPPRFRVARGGPWVPWYLSGPVTWSARDGLAISRGRRVEAITGAP